jgi:NADPH-dependent curcumin reductase CurA
MQGLVVFDFMRDFPVALDDMAGMIAAGHLHVKEEIFEGLEAMPEAFCGLFRGENFGRRIVHLAQSE